MSRPLALWDNVSAITQESMKKGQKPNYFAMRQVLFTRRRLSDVAKDFGLSEFMLKTWIRDLKQSMPRNRCGQTPVDELAEVQRKYDHLQADNAALGVELSRLLAKQADLEAEQASLKAEQARLQGTELED